MPTFDELLAAHEWHAIPGCPGRFTLQREPISFHALIGREPLETEHRRSDQARDPFVVVELQDGGGLLSYVKSDGRSVHTLNTAEGLARKLRDLRARPPLTNQSHD